MVNGVQDATGTYSSELRIAVAGSSSPTSSADWTVDVVDATGIPCGEYCGSGEVCVASDFTCHTEENTCGTCGTAEGCVGGVCVPIIVPLVWTDFPEGIGLYVSADWMSDGRLVAAYYHFSAHDFSAGVVKMAVRDTAGVWTSTIVEGDEYTDVGLYTNLVVGSDDTVHLVFHDALNDELVYTWFDRTLAQQGREIVDDGIRDDGHHVVGLDAEIFLDSAGVVHVFYQDGDDHDLLGAVRNGPDDWSFNTVLAGDGNYGEFIDVAQDTDGTFWAAQYQYDRVGDPLGSMTIWELAL
jgi:hypothetical protein